MLFLKALDNIHEQNRIKYGIPDDNKDFISYIPIEIRDDNHSFSFIGQKREKTKLLMVEGKQKVYFTDAQIVNTILAMADEDIDWFTNRFKALYTGCGAPFQLIFDGKRYDCRGIGIYPNRKSLHLLSDSLIDYPYFSALINFILCKDQCWEKISRIRDYGKKTLCKYIVLIDYYHRHTPASTALLEKIGYPLEGAQATESPETKKIFNKLKHVKQFDISKFI